MTASMKILFCPPAFALWDSLGNQCTLHTFANRTGSPKGQKFAKECNFPTFRLHSNS